MRTPDRKQAESPARMRNTRATQFLSYPIRLPDVVQAAEQAERKQQFALILPLLAAGMIEPRTEKKRVGKNRKAIEQALASVREENADGGSAVELQSLIEQSCNFYLMAASPSRT
jgi:hypothetical protein